MNEMRFNPKKIIVQLENGEETAVIETQLNGNNKRLDHYHKSSNGHVFMMGSIFVKEETDSLPEQKNDSDI